jgi:hypothetical protein
MTDITMKDRACLSCPYADTEYCEVCDPNGFKGEFIFVNAQLFIHLRDRADGQGIATWRLLHRILENSLNTISREDY